MHASSVLNFTSLIQEMYRKHHQNSFLCKAAPYVSFRFSYALSSCLYSFALVLFCHQIPTFCIEQAPSQQFCSKTALNTPNVLSARSGYTSVKLNAVFQSLCIHSCPMTSFQKVASSSVFLQDGQVISVSRTRGEGTG